MLDLSEIEQIDRHLADKTGPSTFFKAKDTFGNPVAVKRVPFKKPANTSEFQDGYPTIEQVRKEAKVLKQLSSHPNIIRLLRYDEDKDFCYLRFPYYSSNLADLVGFMKEKKPILDQETILYIAKQILQALQYMHSKSLLHLDVKPENIMVDIEDHKYICKLIDYGACLTKEEAVKRPNYFQITPVGSCSPECLSSQDSKVTEKSDVFSFGATLFSLVYNQDPYSYLRESNPSLSREAYLAAIKGNHLKLQGSLHPEIQEMLTKCLQFNPDNRPTIKELLKQEIISNMDGLKAIEFDINKMADITYEGLDSINFTGGETQKKHYVDKLNELRPKYPKINLLAKRNYSQKSKLQEESLSTEDLILPLLDNKNYLRSDLGSNSLTFGIGENNGGQKPFKSSLFITDSSFSIADRTTDCFYFGKRCKEGKRQGFGAEFYLKNPDWLSEITSKADRQLETYIGCFKDDLPDGMNNTLIFTDGTVATLTFRNFCISGIVKVKVSDENSTKEYISYQFLDNRLPNKLTIRYKDLNPFVDRFVFDEYVGEFEQTEDIYPTSFKKGKLLRSATGVTFEGEWTSFEDGTGCVKHPTGETFMGDWKRLKRSGQGFCEKKGELRYQGEFSEDKYHGRGKMEDFVHKTVYDGDWVDGLRHGHGKFTRQRTDGGEGLKEIYEGQFEKDVMNGDGKLTRFVRKTVFQGKFKDGRIYNKGTLLIEDPQSEVEKFTGELRETEPGAGFEPTSGTLEFRNGNRYKGEMYKLKPHGKGKMFFSTGKYLMYDGEWHQGATQGVGRQLYPDQTEYEGHFQADRRHGPGILRFFNDPLVEYFDGLFNQDQMEHGKLYFVNGDIYDGKFKNGIPYDQECSFLFNSGDQFQGPILYGEPSGPGKYFRNHPPMLISSTFGQDFSVKNKCIMRSETVEVVLEQAIGISKATGRAVVRFTDPNLPITSFTGDLQEGTISGEGVLVLNENAGDLAGSYTGVFRLNCDIEVLAEQGDVNRIETEGDITVHYQNGDRFKGKMRNLRPAEGRYKCKDYDYKGTFEEISSPTPNSINKPKGRGFYKFANGDTFEGGLDGLLLIEGQLFVKEENVLYIGEFDENRKLHTLSTSSDPRDWGAVYYNEEKTDIMRIHSKFVNGRMVGEKTILEYRSGAIFEGQLKNGKRSGLGKYSINSTVFEGEFQNDQIVYGTMKDTDANIEYEGPFLDFCFHTNDKYKTGKMTKPASKTASVIMKKNENRNQIVVAYTGEFQRGMMHGKGCCDLVNGDRYIGDFYANEFQTSPNSKGLYYFCDGSKLEASWKNGRMDAAQAVIFYYPAESEFEEYTGGFNDEMRPHGRGELIFKKKDGDRRVLNGMVVNGQPHGECTIKYDGQKGKIDTIIFQNGKPQRPSNL